MNTVVVNASNHYEIKIGKGLLSETGRELRALTKSKTVCILSDDHVFPLYGKTVTEALEKEGFTVLSHVIPNGEQSKSIACYAEFLDYISRNHLTRSDWLIALGGGVVGDLCGFAAATYLRGVSYIQVPTTLLAMVDSSVGGKTAIDLPVGKNLCGAFYPPSLVLCDTDALSTLPPAVFSDGMAEVIKYGMIFDRDLFDTLAAEGMAFDRETVITRCIEHKRNVVEADEFDHGERQLLNFGHTPAHGIEILSQFEISHGSAVAIGMAIVTRAAAKRGLCDASCVDRLVSCLKTFSLPTETTYTVKVLTDIMLSDKKRKGNTITLVLPETIGHAVLSPCDIADCEGFFADGMGGCSR